MTKETYKQSRKMEQDELQLYLGRMSKSCSFKKKKGAGSYSRKQKHKTDNCGDEL